MTIDLEQERFAIFAQILPKYLKLPKNMQSVVRDMVNIINSISSDYDDQELALNTLISVIENK